jgi:cell wall-associated protease
LLLNAAFSQTPNWQHLDLQKDGVFGISTEKAYKELLMGKKPVPVIVAVIDAGADTLHEDLKGVLWVNPKKKKFDNGTYGWSYLGSARGNVHFDNLELTRLVLEFEKKDTSRLSGSDLLMYHAEKKSFDLKKAEAERNLQGYTGFLSVVKVTSPYLTPYCKTGGVVNAFKALSLAAAYN